MRLSIYLSVESVCRQIVGCSVLFNSGFKCNSQRFILFVFKRLNFFYSLRPLKMWVLSESHRFKISVTKPNSMLELLFCSSSMELLSVSNIQPQKKKVLNHRGKKRKSFLCDELFTSVVT